jgi:hypothetical protein
MVGVPGRSKACNTCRQRKIAVSSSVSCVPRQGSPLTQSADARVTVSVLSKGPNARNVSNQSGYALGTNASEYLSRIMAPFRTVCKPPHQSFFAPRTRAHLSLVGRRVKYCQWSGASRVHMLLRRAAQTCSYPSPRIFPSVTRSASSYLASSSTATCPTVL